MSDVDDARKISDAVFAEIERGARALIAIGVKPLDITRVFWKESHSISGGGFRADGLGTSVPRQTLRVGGVDVFEVTVTARFADTPPVVEVAGRMLSWPAIVKL